MASATVNMFRQLGSVLGSSIIGTIATVQFSRKLTGDLLQRGVPAPAARAVHDAATSGHSGATLPAALAAPVTAAIQRAFTDASHIALLVAALALLAAVIPVAITVKQRPHRAGAASPTGTAAAVAPAGSMVSGRVRGSGGAPLAGATVTLTSLTGHQAGLGRTTGDGGYEIRVADPGAYTLIAAAAGYQPAAVPVHANGRPALPDVLLDGAARLTGNVLTSRSAEPVPGATLTVADGQGEVVATTVSGEKGQYEFANLTPGPYTLAASAASSQPAALSVMVRDGGETVQDVELATGASVIGTARTGSGGTVPDARVTLLGPDGSVAAVATAGADGRYSLEDIPEGEYTVIAAGYPPSASTLQVAVGRDQSHDVLLGHPQDPAQEFSE
jgi:protocatechuate 3,4-dioxygenase beta subunit